MIFDLLKTLDFVNFGSMIDFVLTSVLYAREELSHGGFFDAVFLDCVIFHRLVGCVIIQLFSKQSAKENSCRGSGRQYGQHYYFLY
jgi:hypothetical protein